MIDVTVIATEYKEGKLIGYKGEHGIRQLVLAVPQELIDEAPDNYSLEFVNSKYELIPYEELTADADGNITLEIEQDITAESGPMKVQIHAHKYVNGVLDAIGKSPMIELSVGPSTSGVVVPPDGLLGGTLAAITAATALAVAATDDANEAAEAIPERVEEEVAKQIPGAIPKCFVAEKRTDLPATANEGDFGLVLNGTGELISGEYERLTLNSEPLIPDGEAVELGTILETNGNEYRLAYSDEAAELGFATEFGKIALAGLNTLHGIIFYINVENEHTYDGYTLFPGWNRLESIAGNSISDYSGSVPGTVKFTLPKSHLIYDGTIVVIYDGGEYYQGAYEATRIDEYSFYIHETFNGELGYVVAYAIPLSNAGFESLPVMENATITINTGDVSVVIAEVISNTLYIWAENEWKKVSGAGAKGATGESVTVEDFIFEIIEGHLYLNDLDLGEIKGADGTSVEVNDFEFIITDGFLYLNNVLIGQVQGADGDAATIEIGESTPSTVFSVTNSGTSKAAVLNFTYPKQTAILELPAAVDGVITLLNDSSYVGSVNTSFTLSLPGIGSLNTGIENKIKLELQAVGSISINWGDRTFDYSVIPTMPAGYYRIEFNWSNNASKWEVSVVPFGVVS